ncbi:putative serine protease 47 [Choloepus didactylus]|uniref:putative serine protease 47 n=1 Tax=Choloepus didactylus TaxID=27675 RepID=UPI00189CBF8D|nr:putative serine protease 47 [Choloepus didactylus]
MPLALVPGNHLSLISALFSSLNKEAPETASTKVGRGVSTVCGKPKVVGKVFGGQDVVAGQWPWQASLLYQGLHLCGAVLIDSHWVLSTAHCFLNKSHAPKDYQVLLGNTELYQQTQHTQKMSVNRIITHPDFEKFHPFGSDIAMLQLHLPVNFTSYITPACLPPPGMQLTTYKSCWITGWGMLSEDTRLLPPFHLQEGKVGLIENELCNMLYTQRTANGKKMVHEEMLCAGDFSSGKSICQGDSGGPLICQLSSAWVLVGLASWGLDCRPPIYPSVFTRVTYFTTWIDGIKRVTPVPEAISAPTQNPLSGQLHTAACSPRLCPSLVPPQVKGTTRSSSPTLSPGSGIHSRGLHLLVSGTPPARAPFHPSPGARAVAGGRDSSSARGSSPQTGRLEQSRVSLRFPSALPAGAHQCLHRTLGTPNEVSFRSGTDPPP